LGACAASARAEETPTAQWDAQQSELCAAALREAEQRYHLPPALLSSIAKVESGRPITSLADIRPWPWTIVQMAPASLTARRPRLPGCDNRRPDILRRCRLHADRPVLYHPHAFASMEEAFDPAANADYAARLLTSLYRGEAGGSWDVAVGLYHSHTSLLAALYRDRVALIGADVLHGTLRGVPLYVQAMRAGTLRLPLGNGSATSINVHRQPARRARHPFTTCQIVAFLGSYLNGVRRGASCTTP
jgi:hypothetical protein